MKTPDEKTIVFTFKSHPLKNPALCWEARVTFPPGAGAETPLPIAVTDGAGSPVAAGVFEFAGRELPVKDGRAEISYGDFIAGKHATALWLHRPGQEPLPGGLTFA